MKNKNKQAKFPVVWSWLSATLWFLIDSQARIKKIMQKDEEVGKVAQATPIVICASIYYYFLTPNKIHTKITFRRDHSQSSWVIPGSLDWGIG